MARALTTPGPPRRLPHLPAHVALQSHPRRFSVFQTRPASALPTEGKRHAEHPGVAENGPPASSTGARPRLSPRRPTPLLASRRVPPRGPPPPPARSSRGARAPPAARGALAAGDGPPPERPRVPFGGPRFIPSQHRCPPHLMTVSPPPVSAPRVGPAPAPAASRGRGALGRTWGPGLSLRRVPAPRDEGLRGGGGGLTGARGSAPRSPVPRVPAPRREAGVSQKVAAVGRDAGVTRGGAGHPRGRCWGLSPSPRGPAPFLREQRGVRHPSCALGVGPRRERPGRPAAPHLPWAGPRLVSPLPPSPGNRRGGRSSEGTGSRAPRSCPAAPLHAPAESAPLGGRPVPARLPGAPPAPGLLLPGGSQSVCLPARPVCLSPSLPHAPSENRWGKALGWGLTKIKVAWRTCPRTSPPGAQSRERPGA